MSYRSTLAVTVPADDTDLVSLARVKSELGITDTSSDTLLGEWITEETTTVTDELNRTLAEETIEETFRRGGSSRAETLTLSRRPVSAIASVTEDGSALDTGNYEIDAQAGLIYRLSANGYRSHWWASVVVVTYTAGYALPDSAPSWATKATIICLTHRWAAKGRDPSLKEINIPGVIEKQWWVGSIGENGALPPGVEDLLAPHRDVNV